jgi:uncharacterized membrane protein (DUF373 family)
MKKILHTFERVIINVLLVLMSITILVSTAELGYKLVEELFNPPFLLFNIVNLQEIFGFFFMVLIGLELLETIKAYLDDDKIHVEVVFLVAMIAVARKIIILDYKEYTPQVLYGISALLLSLSIGYYFIKKSLTDTAGKKGKKNKTKKKRNR